MKLRCLTFNLKGLGSNWFDSRFAALVSLLEPLRPDIVCFQESTVSRRRGTLYNQARAVGEAIGLETAAFVPYGNPVEVMTRERGGIALAARWPMADLRTQRLCSGHDRAHDVRVALFARLMSPMGPVEVATTHLSWRPEESEIRLMQAGMVLQELLSTDDGVDSRLILLGDLNATEDEPAIRLVSEHFQDAYRVMHPNESGHTWEHANPCVGSTPRLPDRRLDYIFCPRKSRVRSCEVVLNRPSPVFPSDHYGVLADLEW